MPSEWIKLKEGKNELDKEEKTQQNKSINHFITFFVLMHRFALVKDECG